MRRRPNLSVRCAHRAQAPTVAVRVLLAGGQSAEWRPGQALVAGRMLVEGTPDRTWDRIAAESEARGMDVAAFGAPEAIGISVDALAADWRRALGWAAELALESSLPSDRFDWVRRQAAGELDSLGEQPEIVAGWAFQDQLYAPHPWGRAPQGSRESLEELTREEVAAFYRRSIERGVIVSVVGDIDSTAARAEVIRLFGQPGGRSPEDPEPPAPSGHAEPVRRVVVPGGDQAHLYLGQLTVPVTHPDRVPLQLAGVVLGAGPGLVGRIPQRVRESEGLAYVTQVATVAGAGKTAGRMSVYLGTAMENVERARRALGEEIERFVSQGPAASELEAARRYLLGSEPFRRETAAQIAALHARAAFYDQPYDREGWLEAQIREVSRDRLAEAVRRHLDPAQLRTTIGVPRERTPD